MAKNFQNLMKNYLSTNPRSLINPSWINTKRCTLRHNLVNFFKRQR